jgi:hypothetical protein
VPFLSSRLAASAGIARPSTISASRIRRMRLAAPVLRAPVPAEAGRVPPDPGHVPVVTSPTQP